MAPALEDGIPAHLRRNIDATFRGKRDVSKTSFPKQPAGLPIRVSAADFLPGSPHAGAPFLPIGYGGGTASTAAGTAAGVGGDGFPLPPSLQLPLPSALPGGGHASPSFLTATYPAAASASPSGSHAAVLPPPSLVENLLASPPEGPEVLGVARAVAGAWATAQEREWYKGQLAMRPERTKVEAERLLEAAIGPLGLDPAVWRKLPERVEAVARRNVMREEALELERLRLEEWNPHVVSASATAAVRAALAEARDAGASTSGGAGEHDASTGTTQGYGEQRAGVGGGGSARGGVGATGGIGGGGAGAAAAAASAAAASQYRSRGSADSSMQRSTSMDTPRYMETNIELGRLKKALGKLVAKHAAGDGTASAPPTPGAHGAHGAHGGGGNSGEWTPFAGRGGAAAAAAAGGGAAGHSHSHRRPSSAAAGGAGGVGGAASESTATTPSGRGHRNSAAEKARREAEREARWEEQTRHLAARMAGYLDLRSPVQGIRVARAAARILAQVRSRSPSFRTGSTTAASGSPGAGAAAVAGAAGSAGAAARLGTPGNSRPLSAVTGRPSGRPASAGGGGGGAAAGARGTPSLSPIKSGGLVSWGTQLDVPGRLAEWAMAVRQQAEEREELTPQQAAQSRRLIATYEAACRRHGLHVEPEVGTALRRSFAEGQANHGHTLELVALALTSREAAAALAEVLPLCDHVETLTLERCVLSADAMAVVMPALWGLKLRRITTPNTDFPPNSWQWLQRALGRPTRWGSEANWWCCVRELALTGNALADQGLCALAEVLVDMPRLEVLVLRQCGLTDLSAPQLERLLEACGAGGLSGAAAAEGGAVSGGGASTSGGGGSESGCDSGVGGARSFAALGAVSLRSMVVKSNTITVSGRGGLRELDLGYNNLGPRAVGALALALPKATRLERLSLAWNSVGGGVAALAWTVLRLGPRHCRLANLDLAGTDLVATDLFALAALLRAWPNVPVRHLNLSYNNLVGVPGQCLMRHINRLVQPSTAMPGSPSAAAAAAWTADTASPPPASGRYASPHRDAAGAAAAATAAAAASSLRGAIVTDTGSIHKPLVPILKMHGTSQAPQAAEGGPVKRLTINPTPLPSAAHASTGAAAADGSPTRRASMTSGAYATGHAGAPAAASLEPGSPRVSVLGVTAAAGDGSATRSGLGFPPPPLSVGTASPSGGAAAPSSAAAASSERRSTTLSARCSSKAAQQQQVRQSSMLIFTTDCVVEPLLPPGVQPRVHPDGRSIYEEEESRGSLFWERERERERNRRSYDTRRAGGSGDGGAGGGAAAAAPLSRTPSGALSSRVVAPAAAQSSPSPGEVAAASAASEAGGLEAGGPHDFHAATLDLARDMPDRATAALLVEQEMEARRHGFRSVFHGLKWRGKVYKRNGAEVSPIDILFRGWAHNLPHEGALELIVRVLPPELCPWLANERLHFNERGP